MGSVKLMVFSILVAVVAISNGENTTKCRRDDGVYYSGNTIDEKKVEGEEDCANWCGRIKECRVWSLFKSANYCSLKTSDSGRRAYAGPDAVSGTKGCATATGVTNLDDILAEMSLMKTQMSLMKTQMSLMKTQMEQLTTKVELHDSLLSSLQMTSTQDSLLSSPQPSECSSYSELNDSWRRLQYDNRGSFPVHCDQSGSTSKKSSIYMTYTQLTAGWYRFTGAAGSKLPTAPAPGGPPTSDKRICGASAVPYIFSGGNPTKQEGIVTRDLCWEYGSFSCMYSNSTVKVAACNDAQGEYFVYELQPVRDCDFAYCAIP